MQESEVTGDRDPYEVLGVSSQAGEAEIHAAYRRLAKRWHPDHNPGDAGAEARFKEIAAAYEVLSDPEQQAQLDRERAEAAAERSDAFSHARTLDDDDSSGRRYSYDRAWDRRDDLDADGERRYPFSVDDIRAPRRRETQMWAVVFGLWVLFEFGNSMLHDLTAELDGTIESSQHVSLGPSDFPFYIDMSTHLGQAIEYTIRKADGGRVTFRPRAPCALCFGHPHTGAHIHKEPWSLSYGLDGGSGLENWLFYDPFCPVTALGNLAVGFAALLWGLIGIPWRPGVW